MRGKRGIRRPLCTCETLCERPRSMSFIWMAMSFCRSQMRGVHNRHGLACSPAWCWVRGVAGRQGVRAAGLRSDGETALGGTWKDAILMRY